MNNLELYAEQQAIIKEAQDKIAELSALIEADVKANGNQTGGGYVAKMKPGRKNVNHKLAVEFADVSGDLISKHTTTKTTSSTAWAKISKEAACDLVPFTTQGEPSLVISAAK